ncbi:MAG: hypothetical protein Q9183_000397 [Haloplaca sp. 2 TL-2023]
MYKMICQQTGWGGQPIKSSVHGSPEDAASRLKPVTSSPRLRITFNGSVSDIMPWKFTPQQREVRVLPGETALAFYTATNKSQDDIIGVATYSVTPAQVAPYFSKIQCFCFEEQRLNAGETVDMPVFFFIDPEFVNDPTMTNIKDITLSYTFFSTYLICIASAPKVIGGPNAEQGCRSSLWEEWAPYTNADEYGLKRGKHHSSYEL